MPNAMDDGYTLVAPGTAGTLHWTWANGRITLDTAAKEDDGKIKWTNFKDLRFNSENIPYVPSILRELGLFPTPGSKMAGNCGFDLTHECVPIRGGSYRSGYNIGLGYEACVITRQDRNRYCGVRLRASSSF